MVSRKNSRRAYPTHTQSGHCPNIKTELFAGPSRADTKTYQLCRQVEEAISCALACAHNQFLCDLYVVGVEPARGSALLRVLVSAEREKDEYKEIKEALTQATAYFRLEIASSIHRKRVPSLVFEIVPPFGHEQEAGQ